MLKLTCLREYSVHLFDLGLNRKFSTCDELLDWKIIHFVFHEGNLMFQKVLKMKKNWFISIVEEMFFCNYRRFFALECLSRKIMPCNGVHDWEFFWFLASESSYSEKTKRVHQYCISSKKFFLYFHRLGYFHRGFQWTDFLARKEVWFSKALMWFSALDLFWKSDSPKLPQKSLIFDMYW